MDDKQTAQLARSIRCEEERMAEYLGGEVERPLKESPGRKATTVYGRLP